MLVATCTDESTPPRGFLLGKVGHKRGGMQKYERLGIFRVFPDLFGNVDPIIRFWEQLPRKTIVIV